MIKKLILILILGIIFLFIYLKYILSNIPTKPSMMENFRIIRMANFIGFQYIDGISNEDYHILCVKYRNKIKDKNLTYEQQDAIWDNMVELYKKQK